MISMNSGSCLAVAAVLLLTSSIPAANQAASRNRILRPVDPSDRAVVQGTLPPWARIALDLGRANRVRMLSSASLVFRLSSAQQANLEKLLQQQQDPTSPEYHRWITPQQYAQRFGITDVDLAKIAAWLKSQNLIFDGISASRTEVFFSGLVPDIENALQTEIHDYSTPRGEFFSNQIAVSLPAAFASEIAGVRGLNNFAPRSRVHPSPRFTSSLSGTHLLMPGDFATIYNLDPLYSQGLDGSGEKIAVVGQTSISLSDIRAFRSASGLSQKDPAIQLVPSTGASTKCADDLTEADLDVEWSGGIAKNASIVYLYSGIGTGTTCKGRTKNVFDALFYAINHTPRIAPVISISYGNCEKNIGPSTAKIFRQWIQQANAQGQTIVAASGDDGAADCDFQVSSATHGLAVDIPASIPEVTGIGGSEFSGDEKAIVPAGSNCAPDTDFWAGSCSLTSGPSAKSYIPETTWNDPITNNGFSAGGGGASATASGFFSKPSWQAGPGVPVDGKRDVPDISLNASPAHDPYLICSQGSCVNGFRDASNSLSAVGGTSAGAPSFAGILAIINQATQSSGQGNANLRLYALAVSNPSAFHDIQSGNNKVPCKAGSPDCPASGSMGFSAGPNYDQATGLGSLDAFNLVTAWPDFSSSPGFTLSASPSAFTLGEAGQSGNATVSITGSSGFVGSVSLSCAVPSNASAKISCSVSPASVSLDTTTTAQSATLTVSALPASAALDKGKLRYLAAALAPGIMLFVTFSFGGREVPGVRSKVLGIAAFLLAGLAISCGGGSSSTANKSQTSSVTYAVTVTGVSGSTSHSFTVDVTVK